MMVSEIEHELLKNEQLVWTGRPKQGIVFRINDFFLVPFSLAWTIGVLLFEFAAFHPNLPFFLPLVGFPFLLIGLFLLFGRYVMDKLRRKNIVYWITDQRIIIKGEKFKHTLRSYPFAEMEHVELYLHSKRYGTIVLGDESDIGGRGGKIEELYWVNSGRYPRLEMIENVQQVFDMIMRLRNESEACR